MNQSTLALLSSSLSGSGFRLYPSSQNLHLVRQSVLAELYEVVDVVVGVRAETINVSYRCSVVALQATQWPGLFEEGPPVEELRPSEVTGRIEFATEAEWLAWIEKFAYLMPTATLAHAHRVGGLLLAVTSAARAAANAGLEAHRSKGEIEPTFEERIRIRDARKRLDMFQITGCEQAFSAAICALVRTNNQDLLDYVRTPSTPPSEAELISPMLHATLERSRAPQTLAQTLLLLVDKLAASFQ